MISIRRFIFPELRSSAGLGGVGPAGMRYRFSDARWIRSSILPFWARYVDNPGMGGIPKAVWTDGFRRSQSIRRTEPPSWASEMAMLLAVVVFPSLLRTLVRRIVLGGLPVPDRRRPVRRARSASAADERPSNSIRRARGISPGVL